MDIAHEIRNRHKVQQEFLGTEKEINEIVPLVSVSTITYQHHLYIEDCINGVLAQVTSFPIEFIIGDDGSTDGTREICKKYAEAYPDKIRLFLRDRSISHLYDENGSSVKWLNPHFNIMSARGKYIALCEGDDYWTDPYKLQKQVDFLQRNPEYSLCVGGYRRVNVYTGESQIVITVPPGVKRKTNGYEFSLDDTKRAWITKTLTAVYRNEEHIAERDLRYVFGRDITLFYEILKTGKGFYFSEEMGVYRIHRGGINSMHHGRVNSNQAYRIYKEMYLLNRDEWTRDRNFFHTLALFNYNLFHRYPDNTFGKKLKLLCEAIFLVRHIKELRFILSGFLSAKIKSKLRR